MRIPERLPERRRVLQLVLGVVLYVVCQLVTTLVAVLAYALLHSGSGDESVTVGDVLAGSGPAGPIGLLAGAVVAVGGLALIVRKLSGRPLLELSAAGAGREIGWGLLIGFGTVALSVAVLTVLGVYEPHGIGLSAGILSGLMIGVGPAVVEEIFYRGVLLRLCDGWFGSWAALGIVSVVFALAHGLSSPAGPIATVLVFLEASLILNLAYLLTRRLWLPIALHLAFNATQAAIFGFRVTGHESGTSLIRATLSGPDLLTGGEAGAEGSIVLVLVGLAAGVAMLVIGLRRGVFLPRATEPARDPARSS